MIERLRQMAIFVRVVDEGSFRAAADKLNVSSSRTSEAVSNLELYLGTTLLTRTTRKILLTNEGRKFYEHASAMLRSAEDGVIEMSSLSKAPSGSLNISIPAFLAASNVAETVGEFVRLHPEVDINITFNDQDVDLLTEGFDVIIHAGGLNENSKLGWTKLGESARILMAGTDYVAAQKKPKRPSDLSKWKWINFRRPSREYKFTASNGNQTAVQIDKQAQLTVDSIDALYYFAAQNFGAAVLPEHFAVRGEKEDALVRLLPEYTLPSVSYFVVWPNKSMRDGLTKFFVQFLKDSMDEEQK